jgi:hypothetical protein
MDVEYELTPEDLFAFQWRAAYRSAEARRGRRNVHLLWFAALFLFALLPAIGRHGLTMSRFDLPFLIASFLTVALLQWGLHRWLLRRAIRRLLSEERPDGGNLGVHRVTLDDDGVLERTVVGETRTAWRGVHRVEEDERYIYVYTQPTGAHVIPRRAFADPVAADAFFRFAHSRAGR